MKRLILSVFTIGLVSVTAFAATRAYFTDQVVLGSDITTGKLDVEILGPNAGGIIIPIDTTQTFTGGLLPGVTTQPYAMHVYNKGWGLSTTPVIYAWSSEKVSGSKLFNEIDVRVTDGNCDWITSNPGGIQERYDGPLSGLSLLRTFPGVLNPNITRCTWFEFTLDENADNSYQGINSVFNLILDATQPENNIF